MAAAVAGYLSNEIVNDRVEELGQNIYGRASCQDSLFLNCGEFFHSYTSLLPQLFFYIFEMRTTPVVLGGLLALLNGVSAAPQGTNTVAYNNPNLRTFSVNGNTFTISHLQHSHLTSTNSMVRRPNRHRHRPKSRPLQTPLPPQRPNHLPRRLPSRQSPRACKRRLQRRHPNGLSPNHRIHAPRRPHNPLRRPLEQIHTSTAMK